MGIRVSAHCHPFTDLRSKIALQLGTNQPKTDREGRKRNIEPKPSCYSNICYASSPTHFTATSLLCKFQHVLILDVVITFIQVSFASNRQMLYTSPPHTFLFPGKVYKLQVDCLTTTICLLLPVTKKSFRLCYSKQSSF